MAEPHIPIESGVPDPFPFMHPVLKRNYGNGAGTTGRVPACCAMSPPAARPCGR